MCDFVSGIITEDKEEILLYDLLSHSETVKHFGIEPLNYREFEWTVDDDGASLIVRVPPNHDKTENYYRACILAKYKTRKKLINSQPEDVLLRAVKQDGCAIQYIKNPSIKVQIEAVKHDGYAIGYIENPSEIVQIEAVKQYGCAIKYIENPSEIVQIEAVKQKSNSIQYIENPSEIVQIEAVKQYGCAIKYIENPYPSVLEYVKSHVNK